MRWVIPDSIHTTLLLLPSNSRCESNCDFTQVLCDLRLPLIEKLGIDTINTQETNPDSLVEERTIGDGFDVIFDATGHHSGMEYVQKGGQIVMVGILNKSSEVAFTDSVRGEVDINTSYGSTWRNFEQALRLIESGAIDATTIMDTSYSVSNPANAFEAFLESDTCKPVFSSPTD